MRFDYFAPTQLQDFGKKCLQVFHSGEIGIFMFPPKISRGMRADYVVQEHGSKYKMDQVSFSSYDVDNIEDVALSLIDKYKKTDKEIGIFFTNPDIIVYQQSYEIIDSLVKVHEEKPNLRFIFLFDIDITHPEIARHFRSTALFSNVYYYPLYKEKDANDFVTYLSEKWQFEVPDRVREKIVYKCGGHLWLLKYTMRALRDDPRSDLQEIFESEQMIFRLEQISNLFLDSEKALLRRFIKGESIEEEDEKHSLRYLTKMNIVNGRDLTIPLLEDHLRKSLPKVNIQITDKHVLLNDIRVDSQFSRQEKRVFKLLLELKNQVVTRDEIAKAIWPINTEESYSDWAVDRLIARLRTKIISLGLPKDIIKTFRNRGYMLIN